eukprot:3560659-Ditylum_brightwellii.AAC.1
MSPARNDNDDLWHKRYGKTSNSTSQKHMKSCVILEQLQDRQGIMPTIQVQKKEICIAKEPKQCPIYNWQWKKTKPQFFTSK